MVEGDANEIRSGIVRDIQNTGKATLSWKEYGEYIDSISPELSRMQAFALATAFFRFEVTDSEVAEYLDTTANSISTQRSKAVGETGAVVTNQLAGGMVPGSIFIRVCHVDYDPMQTNPYVGEVDFYVELKQTERPNSHSKIAVENSFTEVEETESNDGVWNKSRDIIDRVVYESYDDFSSQSVHYIGNIPDSISYSVDGELM